MTTAIKGKPKQIWATYDQTYDETEVFRDKEAALHNVSRDPNNIFLIDYTRGNGVDKKE